MKKQSIDLELAECIIKTKADLNNASKNFEQAEGELIDYYLYQIKAHKAKLDYLIKEVKEKNYTTDELNEFTIGIG